MSDKIKYEFIKILDELEEASNAFDALQAETVALKEQYSKDPNNPELLAYIKLHEEKYREVYERFQTLNARSKELKEASDAESDEDNK